MNNTEDTLDSLRQQRDQTQAKLEEVTRERNQLRTELENQACIADSRLVFAGKLDRLNKDLEKQVEDAALALDEMNQRRDKCAHQRDIARAEVERLTQALHDARIENSGQAALLERTRPEPSRLEIAAMFLCNAKIPTTYQDALEVADKLIAAAKEEAK